MDDDDEDESKQRRSARAKPTVNYLADAIMELPTQVKGKSKARQHKTDNSSMDALVKEARRELWPVDRFEEEAQEKGWNIDEHVILDLCRDYLKVLQGQRSEPMEMDTAAEEQNQIPQKSSGARISRPHVGSSSTSAPGRPVIPLLSQEMLDELLQDPDVLAKAIAIFSKSSHSDT